MTRKTWRDIAAPIISQVIYATVGLARKPYSAEQVKEIKKNLRAAYPFGERMYHPYKIWLDEIKRQLGLRPVKTKPIVESKQVSIYD